MSNERRYLESCYLASENLTKKFSTSFSLGIFCLDKRIRKQRTIKESEIIPQVKSFGISTPLIYFLDFNKCSILMQYIDNTLQKLMPLHNQ